MIEFHAMHPRAADLVGFLPMMLDDSDSRLAAEQFNESYAHGGGWNPFKGFVFRPDDQSIKYPGDPAYKPVAMALLGDETIYVYEHAWVAIVQPDGSYEISRMD